MNLRLGNIITYALNNNFEKKKTLGDMLNIEFV